jgi:hypothetical protein
MCAPYLSGDGVVSDLIMLLLTLLLLCAGALTIRLARRLS